MNYALRPMQLSFFHPCSILAQDHLHHLTTNICRPHLISCSTRTVSDEVCSKLCRFLSFHRFQAVYIISDAFVLRSFLGRPASSCSHHAAMGSPSVGIFTRSCVQSEARCHTSFAKQHCKIKWSAISCSWLQSEQIGSHGQSLYKVICCQQLGLHHQPSKEHMLPFCFGFPDRCPNKLAVRTCKLNVVGSLG